jgi:hypothetical protein
MKKRVADMESVRRQATASPGRRETLRRWPRDSAFFTSKCYEPKLEHFRVQLSLPLVVLLSHIDKQSKLSSAMAASGRGRQFGWDCACGDGLVTRRFFSVSLPLPYALSFGTLLLLCILGNRWFLSLKTVTRRISTANQWKKAGRIACVRLHKSFGLPLERRKQLPKFRWRQQCRPQ